MTNRLTNGDGKPQAETPTTADFSRYKVCDSYSVPVTDSTSAGGSPDSAAEPSRRISKRQLMELDVSLGSRDKEILRSIQRHRYLMTGQVQRLLFTDAVSPSAALRAASRSLKKLKSLGLVGSLSRRIGGVRAGSGSLIWHITHAGERLLRLHGCRPYASKRFFEPSPYFLAHTLAVAEASIRIMEICNTAKLELSALQPEPECWRSYSERGRQVSLKPDLYAAVTSPEYEDRYFLEIDLDTESSAKVIEKCQKYHAYYRSGLEQKEHGMFPLTVWIVPSAKRKEHLTAHIHPAFSGQPRLFIVITDDELEHLILEGGDRDALC